MLINFFLDIFYPKRCVGCGREGYFVCIECVKKIEINITSVCSVCGRINESGQYCRSCRDKIKSPLCGLIIAAHYDKGPTKEMIHHLKYSGFLELVPLLSQLIYERMRDKMPRGELLVVPVPLFFKKEARRGFNQAELIAKDLSEKMKLHGALALTRTKDTATQINLSKKERKSNLKGAFICEDDEIVKGKTVLLIDDVTTSGSTLNECAKALLASGAKKVWGVVVAKRI